MVANTSITVAFVAVGVGTFVATLILFGSALFVYRFMGRRWKRLHNVHKNHRQHTEKPLSATDDINEVAEYEQIAMKSAETRTSVSDKRESVTSDEPTKQYERLDESRKETGQYSQLPALYEQMQTSRENTESGSVDIKETHHAMKDYINIRI